MKRMLMIERPGWRAKAEAQGFRFHTMYGEAYWDETSAYMFDLRQIEQDIEDPCTELHAMCREAAAHIVTSERLMERMGIPSAAMDLVAGSWKAGEPEFYGRFDLAYDAQGPAKLLEYNADTPTSVFESGAFQWEWLQDQIAAGKLPDTADQFNALYDAMVTRFREIIAPGTDVHFAAMSGSEEDYGTVETIAWAARDAGLGAHFTEMEKIGLTDAGQFADSEGRVIGTLFKLYPWEDLLRDDYAANIAGSGCRFIEPAWKAVVSNKGLLAVLWEMFEGHRNLLPAFFKTEMTPDNARFARAAETLSRGSVIKPIFSREGSSIVISEYGQVVEASADLAYEGHPQIVQGYQRLPEFDGFRPIIGAWVVGTACVGMAIREDRSRITQDLSRFKPHFIMS